MISALKFFRVVQKAVGDLNALAVGVYNETITVEQALPQAIALVEALLTELNTP